jgi:hypothetical protein
MMDLYFFIPKLTNPSSFVGTPRPQPVRMPLSAPPLALVDEHLAQMIQMLHGAGIFPNIIANLRYRANFAG